jgi:PAS domain S-box-containing protein
MTTKKKIFINKTENLNYLPLAIVWILNDKIVFTNTMANKYLSIKPTNKEIKIEDIFNKVSVNKITKHKDSLIKNKKNKTKIILEILKKNKKLESDCSLINIEKERVLQIIIKPHLETKTLSNQHQPKANKEKFNYSYQILKTVLETSNHIIWFVNSKFQIINYNNHFFELIHKKYGLKIFKGIYIPDLIHKKAKDYNKYWHPKYIKALKGKTLKFIKDDFIENQVYMEIFISPIYSQHNQIKEVCCVAHDITNTILYEKKLSNQRGRLSAIFDSSHHYIWTIDKYEKLTSFNKNYFDLVTNLYSTQPYVGLVLDRGALTNDKQYTSILRQNYRIAFEGKSTNFELETQVDGNKIIFLEVFLNPIFENNKVIEVSGIAHDITEKRIVHQKMEMSLKEKEVLLKEVHHRVKNNMQVISSILNLQSFYVKDDYALGLLKESQNRISTMAYIHESLYQSNSFTSVNFSSYFKKLVSNIVSSYTFESENIILEQDIEEIELSLDLAIPLGLIINELITNSLKHAFKVKKSGIVGINLRKQNNFVLLDLMDNGIGLNQGFKIENSQSLGLQLVSTLIEQLGAKYKITTKENEGTKFNISFQIN